IDVLDSRTQAHQQFHTGCGCRTRTQANDLGVFELLVGQLQGVDHRCGGDNGSAILVVMEYRNIALLDQRTLDLEALRRLDIFEVDTNKGAGNELRGINERLRTFRLDFDIENVDTGETIEQHALAFHVRRGSLRTQVAQTENGSAI